jgi:hypothetical protein
LLGKLSPQQVRLTDLAGEKIKTVLTRAPGNGAPICFGGDPSANRSILHTDYGDMCAKLASLGLPNDKGGIRAVSSTWAPIGKPKP